MQHFGSNIAEGVAESCVEAEMSRVEVDGAGWGWVELGGAGWRSVELGARFSNTPRDRRNFLHYTSAHPRSLIKSIPHSQALFLKKNLYGNSRAFKESSSVKGIKA